MPVSPISPARKSVAILIALAADALQLYLLPLFFQGVASPFDDLVDLLVAFLLIIVLGFRWRFILALFVELIPFIALFPTWTLFVATLPTTRASKGPLRVQTLPKSNPRVEPMEDRTHL